MAKRNKQVAEAVAAAVVVDGKPAQKQYILRVSPEGKFSAGSPEKPNARLQWYKRLLEFNGKTLAEFTASCVENPPSMPAKGIYYNRLEPVGGWVSFFKGNKKGAQALLTLEEVEQ